MDLLFTKDKDRVLNVEALAPFPRYGHCLILFQYVFGLRYRFVVCFLLKRSWQAGNYGETNERMLSINWELEFSCLSLDGMFWKLQCKFGTSN